MDDKVNFQALQCVRPSPTILPVTAENLLRLETTGSKMEEGAMMGRMEAGAGIDLSLPITSTYLRRMRGLSCEPKVSPKIFLSYIIFQKMPVSDLRQFSYICAKKSHLTPLWGSVCQ